MMRKFSNLLIILGMALMLLVQPGRTAAAEKVVATQPPAPTATVAPYPPPVITEVKPTPTITSTPTPAGRPLVVVESYYLDQDTIQVGDSFTLSITLKNQGQQGATNLILTMINDSFLPQDNGGVVAVGSLTAGNHKTISHAFLVSQGLFGQPVGTIPAHLTYSGPDGTQYTESFAITLQLRVYYGPAATQTTTPTVTPTATTPPLVRPQLVVSSYTSSVDPLQPGSLFDLEIKSRNLGNALARSVTVVLGGGVTPDTSGTPSPGGVSGGGSDLTNFAPIGSSNLFFVGDVAAEAEAVVQMHLIVNVSTNPGAYTLKLSFVYNDPKGLRLVDDQIITLLIYQLPLVETSFYRDPGVFFSGQPNVLPIQVTNLGRKSTVLGNLKVSAAGGEVTNNVGLVGPLDPGGSFTLDANFIPQQAGEQQIDLLISYTDDFNQPRQVNSSIQVNVQDGAFPQPELTPGVPGGDGGGIIPPPVEETVWDKVLRFVKGLLGLDSGLPQPVNSVPAGGESVPLPSDGKSAPATGPLKSP